MRLIKSIYHFINEKLSISFYSKLRKRLINKGFTLISNNCLGGIIYHNLGLQFKSPTINLDFLPEHYLLFITNLRYYASKPIAEVTGAKIITGVIKGDSYHPDVMVRFHHYDSFLEAKEKWELRCKRIDFDNIFFLYEHYENENIKCLLDFVTLASNKNNYLSITHRNHFVNNEKTVRNYKNDDKAGKLCKWMMLTGRKYLDEIDYTSWLNKDPFFWK